MVMRSSLGRTIILLSFAIITLIIYSVRLSKRPLYDTENPMFQELIPWQYEGAEHQLLLHSIDFGIVSFTAFSTLADTIIRIQANEQEIDWAQNQLLRLKPPLSQCTNCHK